MSAQLFKDDILFEQRILACGGFYTGKLDGKWGPLSEKAQQSATGVFSTIRSEYGEFNSRSEKAIATLLPSMQIAARKILHAAYDLMSANGYDIFAVGGTRTYAQQNLLFNQRPKVTNAKGGQSWHNFGLAIDVGIFQGMKYLTGATKAESKLYADLGAYIKANVSNIEWGGDWKFVDMPHYQYATGLTLAQARAKFEKGQLKLG